MRIEDRKALTGSKVEAANWNQRVPGGRARTARWEEMEHAAAKWVIWTPFGFPVDPEVKRTSER